jgi:hypothetical protein
LREVVLRGAVELSWEQVASLSVFLLALGTLLRFANVRTTNVSVAEVASTSTERDRVADRTPS